MSDDQALSAPVADAQNRSPSDEKSSKPEVRGSSRKFSEVFDPQYELTNQQLLAIHLALQGLPWRHIAEKVGVSPRTIWTWRNENFNFQKALDEAFTQRRQSADQRIHNQADRAAEILAAVMENPSHKLQVRAAQLLLQASARLRPRPKSTDSTPQEDTWPEPVIDAPVG